jgi:hypothetical protein
VQKQLEDVRITPQRVRDDNGVVHSYWASCNMWATVDEMVKDDEPLTCLICIAQACGNNE